MTVRKVVYTIAADHTKDVAVFEHDLGPDVIVQVHSERGRIQGPGRRPSGPRTGPL